MRQLRFILVLIVVVGLAGCTSIPLLDVSGEPVLDPVTREQETELVVDEEAVGMAVEAAVPFLPFPFNLLLPAVLGVVTMLRKENA